MTTEPRRALVTPEAVVLGLEPAGLGSRALAWVVDTALIAVTIGAVALAAAWVARDGGGTAAVVVFLVASSVIAIGYPIAFETLWSGRTPGKAMLGLRVVTTEGTPVRFRHAAVRAALSIVDVWGTGGAAAAISVLVTRRAQRLGDLAAGALVVSVPRARSGSDGAVAPPVVGTEHLVAAIDISGLGVDELVAVRRYGLRVADLDPDVRDRVAARLWEAIGSRVGGVGNHDVFSPHELLLVVAAAAAGGVRDDPAR